VEIVYPRCKQFARLIDLRKALCRHGSNGPLLQARCRQSCFIKLAYRQKFHANGAHSYGVEVVSDVRAKRHEAAKSLATTLSAP
jgi:hypothetical protein